MTKLFQSMIPSRRSMAFGAIWLLCWIVPWGKVPTIQAGNLLAFITEMPRLGFVLLLVMIPGMLLYLLLNPKDEKIVLYNQLEIMTGKIWK